MRILLTGGSGLVGSNILEQAKALNAFEFLTPSSKELNLLDQNALVDFLQTYKVDCVVHCAGRVGGIAANIAEPVEFLTQNAYMGLNLITQSLQAGVKHFLNIASSCMYPRNAKNPLKETSLLKGELEPTNEGYALAKILATKLCAYITRTKEGFIYKSAIPCNLYGRFDSFNLHKAHLLPAIIVKIHEAKMQGLDKVEIWGDGTARREFMYAGDFAKFVFYALEHFSKMPQNLNVGLGYDYTITQYYQTVAKVLGYKGDFVYNLQKPSGMQQKLTDIALLEKFGFKAKSSLEEGIQQSYAYFLSTKEKQC